MFSTEKVFHKFHYPGCNYSTHTSDMVVENAHFQSRLHVNRLPSVTTEKIIQIDV